MIDKLLQPISIRKHVSHGGVVQNPGINQKVFSQEAPLGSFCGILISCFHIRTYNRLFYRRAVYVNDIS